MLNENRKVEKNINPFPYVIIQNFFDENFFQKLKDDFPKKNEFSVHPNNVGRMHYDTTYGDTFYSSLLEKSEAYNELHNFIYSKEFINFFLEIFKLDIANELRENHLKVDVRKLDVNSNPYEVGEIFNKNNFGRKKKSFLYPRLDIGLGELGYGINTGGNGIHIDNPQRLISMLFYVGGFEQIEGGEHRIWKKKNDNLEIERVIKPEPNMLIASIQNNISYHDVNPITRILGTRNAFYIAISCNSSIWKKIKINEFNLKYNRNRCKTNFFYKLKKKFF